MFVMFCHILYDVFCDFPLVDSDSPKLLDLYREDFRALPWRPEANLRKAMKNRAKPEKNSWKQQAAGWFFIVSDRFQSLF
jgi:hypothetical protein